jgi:hypothetical protein
MFRFIPLPTFTVPVPLSVPGMPEPIDLMVEFRWQDKAALDAWLATVPGRPDAVVLHEVIVGWQGMTHEGAEVPYSLTALGDFLTRYGLAARELMRAYLAELTESKKKISPRSPGG